jgi:hypothetical protein
MTSGFFEKVCTMTGYYDGPRVGVANFEGRPHLYESEWNDLNTNEEPIYLLSPVDQATLELALEDWAIWLRWERARHDGEATDETHPALPFDRVRHEAIKAVLESRLVTAPSPIRARGVFRRARHVPWDGKGHSPPLEVQWSRIEQ